MIKYTKQDIIDAVRLNTIHEKDSEGLDLIQRILKNDQCSLLTVATMPLLFDADYDFFGEKFGIYNYSNDVIQWHIETVYIDKIAEKNAIKLAKEEQNKLSEILTTSNTQKKSRL